MSDNATEISPMDEAPSKVKVPDWYPDWAREMANLYFAANTCLFVLHGNVNDLFHYKKKEDGKSVDDFCGLNDFLATQIFGSWDLVTAYDMGRGIQPLGCLLYTSPSPRDATLSRMPSSA